jgi:hypothetical protein
MLCQKCGLQGATVHLESTVFRQKTVEHLCALCAGARKPEAVKSNGKSGPKDPFAAIRRNYRIKAPQVRVISAKGKQLGVLDTPKAVSLALEVGLDLVEVAPSAVPPVCRVMDFGKYVFEVQKKHLGG